ncbi:RHS repeat-associated core domain-containing protein [Conexibacter woesei]|uniref:RHS repeat-associated core domain-containing protein n=1 Tax=Conexibacter woesei TaxID=191495 RepID=UPI000479A88A|nr:RHS repeat-associated core domain-containing protein [Conexibacter woesei]
MSLLAGLIALVVTGAAAPASPPRGALRKAAVPARRSGAKVLRELPSLRTATARTYLLADGTRRTSIWSHPVNVRDGSGAWKAVDTTLRADGSEYRTTAAPTTVTLPDTLDRPVHVEDSAGRSVDFALQGASDDASAQVSGDRATYDGVRSGVDASYATASNGVKETLTLADATAPSTYTFNLNPSAGLTPKLRGDGSVDLTDDHGTTRFTIPAPTVQEHGAAAPVAAHARYALSADGGTLTLTVDRDWLSHAAFPVAVDPSLWTPWSTDCTISNGSLADTPDCDDVHLRVGYDGSHVQRALLRFPDVETANIPVNATVQYAQLGLTLEQMSNTAVTPRLDAAPLSHAFDGGATWNAYDGVNSWPTPGGDTAPANGLPPITSNRVEQDFVGGGIGWDVTAVAQSWVRTQNVHGSTGSNDNGIMIKANDETQNALETIGGPEDYDANHDSRPLLDIDWRARPGSERDQSYESIGIDDRSDLRVNVTTGNMAVEANDINIPGVNGMDLNVSRTYNSEDVSDQHMLGSAWTESINGAALKMDFSWLSHGHTLYANGGAVYRFENTDANIDSIGAPNLATPSGFDGRMVESASTNGVTVTWPDGRVWTYGDDLDGYHQALTQIKDAHGNTITLHYTNEADPTTLSSITDSYGNTLTVNHNAGGVITSITDAQGRSWRYGLTGTWHNLDSYTNPDGKITRYTYDTSHPADIWDWMNKITDARGHDIQIGYSGATGDWQQVTSVTRVVDGGANDVKWQFDYAPADGFGHSCSDTTNGRTVETDPRGKLTTYCYNADGQVVETWDALRRRQQQAYNAQGNVTSAISAAGGTGNPLALSYTNDANHNLYRGDEPSGASFGLTYCQNAGGSNGCADGVAGSMAEHSVSQVTDEQGTRSDFDYNATGDLTRVMADTSPTVAGLALTYNTDGTLATSRDGNGNTTTYSYTGHNLTTIAPPGGGVLLGNTTFTYYPNNKVRTVTDGLGTTATLVYDGEDRVTSVTYSNGKSYTITYDNDGNPTARVERSGATTVNTTSYTYDNLNRRTGETFPGSLTNGYGYDKIGNLTSLTDPMGTTTYAYDDINRLTSILSPKTGTANCSTTPASCDAIGYGYTDLGGSSSANGGAVSRQTATFPGANLTEILQADANGAPTSIAVKNHAGTVLQGFSYTYQQSGGREQALVSKVVQQPGTSTTAYRYDNTNAQTTGALTSAITTNSGGTQTDNWGYTYDRAGNRVTRRHTVSGTTTTTTYAYNAVNELCWAYTGTSANACGTPPSGATTYAFDRAGNQTTGSNTYDALSRVTGTSGSASLSYLTPGQQELVGYGSNAYHNDLLGLTREIVGGATTGYTRQPDGTPVAQRSATTKQYLFANNVGSITALGDDNANSLTRTYSYDPDGNRTSTGTGTGTGVVTDLGFDGGQLLPNGTYHYGARFYDPSIARWTQQDPLSLVASQQNANRYAFVGGNPVNYVDLAGYASDVAECGVGAATGAAGGAAEGGWVGAVGGAAEGCITSVACKKGGEAVHSETAGALCSVATGYNDVRKVAEKPAKRLIDSALDSVGL